MSMNLITSEDLPEEVDVLVVGSGAAGLTAAITAAHLGAVVLVVEKADKIGGVTAWSGGAAWLPGNRYMPTADALNDRELARGYLQAILGERYDETLVDAFLHHAPELVTFLETNTTAVSFQAFGSPDYYQHVAGAQTSGRSIIPQPFDAETLGPALKQLRTPFHEYLILGGMQVEPSEALHLQRAYKSKRSLSIAVRLLFRHIHDLVIYGRNTRLIRGNALVARLLKSALDLNIRLVVGSPARRLLMEGSRVAGAFVERAGFERCIRARRGVILATGGFASSDEMRAQWFPYSADHISLFPWTHTADGIRMAMVLGGSLGQENANNGHWTPVSIMSVRGGRRRAYPHFAFDRCKPGSVIVDRSGSRFVNEAASYHEVVSAMHHHHAVPAFLVANREFLRKYGMGLARPFPFPYRHLIDDGYLIEAQSLRALASSLRISAEGLEATASRLSAFAATGVDSDFGRGGDIYNRSLGDPEHHPNPCLGALGEGPYYAVRLFPGNAGTALGLRTNASAQVLGAGGFPITGLYACGLDMNSVMRGHYPGAGCMLGPAMTFGYIAGRHITGPDGAPDSKVPGLA